MGSAEPDAIRQKGASFGHRLNGRRRVLYDAMQHSQFRKKDGTEQRSRMEWGVIMSYAQLKPAVSWLSTSARPRRDAARRIGILLFDGFSLLGAGMIAELFHMANAIAAPDAPEGEAGQLRYDVRFLSLTGGSIACAAAVHVWTDEIDPGQPATFDLLFVAAGEARSDHGIDDRVLCWLRAAHRKTATVRPIAQGRAVLDAAGIAQMPEPHPSQPRSR